MSIVRVHPSSEFLVCVAILAFDLADREYQVFEHLVELFALCIK